ncbi:MAG: phosphomannomutase [Mycobacteriales bacterium]
MTAAPPPPGPPASPTAAAGPNPAAADLRRAAEAWVAEDPDPDTRAELAQLLASGNWAGVAERFAGPLEFGTAGLRGPLRAGPSGMNRAVVLRAAAGLAAYLHAAGAAGPVVVGYDARHKSSQFAHDSAAVLAGAGFAARLLPRPLPTPVLAYAVRRFGAAAGVMVTASHNPPQDNGYKVYLSDGAQLVPPADREIEAAIATVGPLATVPRSDDYTVLDDGVLDGYLASVAALPRTPHRDLTVVYTAMHGVGAAVVRAALTAAGFAAPTLVTEQAAPDPDFPTVAFPNPEEPGAMDLAFARATAVGADLVIAHDPDADRCAVGVPTGGGWRMLRGDEVGALLADHLIRTGAGTGTFATTIVSSALLQALCAARGVPYAQTLTGFKWIVRAAGDLRYGYEEALGYAVEPTLVRDKDGISAAVLVADLAASLRAEGRTLLDRLDDLAAEFGVYATDQVSVRVEDLTLIDALMHRLRASPPATLLGRPVTVEDLLPDADVLRLRADRCRVVVRPSGTEPKLKAYLEVIEPAAGSVPAGRATAATTLTALRAEITALLAPPTPAGG